MNSHDLEPTPDVATDRRRPKAAGPARLREADRRLRATEAPRAIPEARLADIFDGLADGIVIDRAVRDESGQIVDFIVEYANEAACRLTGLKADELVGLRILDLFPAQRENGQFDACVRVVETGQSLVRETFRGHETPARSHPDAAGLPYATSATKLGDGCVATLHDIGARKRAEDALARSQQLIQLILDTIPLRVFWKDRDGAYLGCNRAFLTESSMSDPGQIIGKTDFELDWRDRAEQFRAEDLVVLESGKPQLGFEKPELHYDGRHTLVRLNKVPLLDEDGNVVGLLGTIEDLSDHLRTEKALKESEAFLASILENIPSMVYVKDARTLTFVRVNRATEQVLGRSSQELVSPRSRELGPPDESDYYARMDQQVVDTGQLMEFPLEVLTPPDGRPRFLRTKKVPLFDDQGKPQFVLGISEDVTDLKLAEDARRETEERYRRIVDTISDYVVSVKIEDGHIVETAHGAGCFALTGYTAEELTRDPGLWMSLVVADDNAAAHEQTRRILAGEPPEPLEHRIVRRDGAVRWVRQTPVIRMNADGLPVGYDGVVQDITESRELQEQLLQSANLDSLTGAGSRRLMDFELNQLMAGVRRTGHPAAIVMIDIDNFKLYNDAYGHGAGDTVLVDVARSIGQSIRPDDRLYRYGGEEFLVVLRASTLDGAVSAAGRIVGHVAKQAIGHAANQPWGVVTISAGAALMTPDQGSLAAVLAEADKALYESKANGRNRVSPDLRSSPEEAPPSCRKDAA